MSELTRCNRCRLLDIQRRHGAARVTTRLVLKGPARGWTEVFVDDRRVASFMALTDHCVC